MSDVDECDIDVVLEEGLQGTLNLVDVTNCEILADCNCLGPVDERPYCFQNNSDDPELNAVMGEILCARDDCSGAKPYLKKSLNTKPEYVSHVHALLGKVYAQTNRTDQAIAELRLALADDKDGHIHYQIARLYLKVGDRDAAGSCITGMLLAADSPFTTASGHGITSTFPNTTTEIWERKPFVSSIET